MKQTRKINYKLLNIIIDIIIEMCHKNLPQNISHQRAKIIETQIIKLCQFENKQSYYCWSIQKIYSVIKVIIYTKPIKLSFVF